MGTNRCVMTMIKEAEQYQIYKSIKNPSTFAPIHKSASIFQNILET
jgi:hypothetical protein